MRIYCRRCFKNVIIKVSLGGGNRATLVCMAVHKIGCTLLAVMSTRVI